MTIARQRSLFGDPPKSVNKVYDKVVHVLANHPEARGNDKELFLRVWKLEGFDEVFPSEEDRKRFEKWFRSVATTPETIRRTRQGLQQHGRYRPDDRTYRARQEEAEKYRRFFGADDEDTYG